MRHSSKGSAESDLLWFVGIIFVLGLFWWTTGGPSRPALSPFTSPDQLSLNQAPAPNFSRLGTQAEPESSLPAGLKSIWFGQVIIRQGTAASANAANQEYISLEYTNRQGAPVDLTGWTLTNGKNQRYYLVNNVSVPGQSDVVTVPAANRLFVLGGVNASRDRLILSPGGRAIIVTGSIADSAVNYSFLVNRCSGYLNDRPDMDLRFVPSLLSNCPDPATDFNLNGLDQACYQFVRSLGRCHTPKFTRNERTYVDYVDYTPNLNGACQQFIQQNFNYNACVVRHQSDPDFYGNEWRIFLHRSWELWADNRETISLYDQSGKLVDQLSY